MHRLICKHLKYSWNQWGQRRTCSCLWIRSSSIISGRPGQLQCLPSCSLGSLCSGRRRKEGTCTWRWEQVCSHNAPILHCRVGSGRRWVGRWWDYEAASCPFCQIVARMAQQRHWSPSAWRRTFSINAHIMLLWHKLTSKTGSGWLMAICLWIQMYSVHLLKSF